MTPNSSARPRSKKFWRWLAVLFLLCTVCFTIWIVFSPIKSGESRRSPDQRYEASAMNVQQRNLWGEWIHHVELKVIDLSTDKVIWEITYQHPPDADVCDYFMRGVKFVQWAEDSTSVTIPTRGQMGGQDEMTFRVP
jgi:hypothetical protein